MQIIQISHFPAAAAHTNAKIMDVAIANLGV
jgi:hypothetical protein